MMFMFLKTTKKNGYEYLYLVESYRDEDGKSRHRTLFGFGRKDVLIKSTGFSNMVRKLCQIAEIRLADDFDKKIKNDADCGEAEILNYGYHAYRALWELLHIGSYLREINKKSKISFELSETTFLMAAQHLLEPRSKLSTFEHRDGYYGLPDLKLQHLYKTLDKLAEEKESIENFLFDMNYKIVGKKVDVVFYDVTTFAFESFTQDELRNFGFSKDCKFNEVQVVMGLLIDLDGMPLGYELFPGNTYEGKTMCKALDILKEKFGINKVIITADRGLNSKENLCEIKKAGYGYIMAAKLKSMKTAIKSEILDQKDYTTPKLKDSDKFRYKIIDYKNEFKDKDDNFHVLEENLIVSYSEKRANKDKKDRQRLVDKANKLLENPSTINEHSKRGGKKYIKNQSKKSAVQWALDSKKIENDAKWDGYYGIQTSEKNMSPGKIIEAYHTLWKIEESFRIMKSTLEVKPIFHWKPSRIRGHFVMCFLAFMMERKLELLLSESGIDKELCSPLNIREALGRMQFAKVRLDNEDLYFKTKNNTLGVEIFKLLGLKLPQNLNREKDLISFMEVDKITTSNQLAFY